MKKFIVACLIGLGSFAATAAPSAAQGASVTVIQDGGYRHGPDWRRDHHDRRDWRRHHRPRCFTKVVRTRHHGEVIIRKTRVCR
ncbi:hypothetical protein [Rhizobium paknamense]|uniref:Uncharacterized protein n=1 Tax=Rhizobium paknamense TaxID=1206817 RepID=A0ABU0I892_9HYPH|nr:hypothetical protein [Rhizobium paknamense]MDQ0453695.1 hypothetical protein [Rhizobium paknamense]